MAFVGSLLGWNVQESVTLKVSARRVGWSVRGRCGGAVLRKAGEEEAAVVEDKVEDVVAEGVAEEVKEETDGVVAEATSAEETVVVEATSMQDEETPQGEGSGEVAEETRGGDRRQGGRRPQRTPLTDIQVNEYYEGTVKTTTNYGAFVDIGTITDGLLHVSQLADRFVASVEDVVKAGDKIRVRVLAVDPKKREISLTLKTQGSDRDREAADKAKKEKKEKERSAWAQFKFDPETFVTGKVMSTLEYGAFIDVGAPTDGMVHISEMSDQRTESVSDVMKVGDEVSVRITSVDTGRNRISLSMKQYVKPAEESLQEDLKALEDQQPKFKTSFELAFERANAKNVQ